MNASGRSSAPPLGKTVVGPATPVIMSAELDTPPSSPAGLHNGGFRPYGHRTNAFSSQWGPASPALSQMTDDESDGDESSGSYSPPSLDEPSTPKSHPLENSRALLWTHHFDSHAARSEPAQTSIGLGLGLVGNNDSFHRPKLDLSEDAFEVRERERRAGKVHRPSLVQQQPKTWPKIRIPRRSRAALYLAGCVFSLLLFILTHRTSTAVVPVHQTYMRSSPGLRRGGSTSTAIVNRRAEAAEARARKNAIPASSRATAVKAKQWTWASRDEELAALINYIVAAEANHITALDASAPLDPSLLLDFDPYARSAGAHLLELQHDLWTNHPVVVLFKQRNAHSRFIKSELEKLHLEPKPFFVDTSVRDDTDILVGLLDRLVERSDLPLVFVGGKAIGGWPEIDDLIKSSLWKPLLADAGAISVPNRKKAKRAGHGGKTPEQIEAEIEAEKLKDEERRRALNEKIEALRLM